MVICLWKSAFRLSSSFLRVTTKITMRIPTTAATLPTTMPTIAPGESPPDVAHSGLVVSRVTATETDKEEGAYPAVGAPRKMSHELGEAGRAEMLEKAPTDEAKVATTADCTTEPGGTGRSVRI